MMTVPKRLSLNSSLRKIFQEEFENEFNDPTPPSSPIVNIKTEVPDSDLENEGSNTSSISPEDRLAEVKNEPNMLLYPKEEYPETPPAPEVGPLSLPGIKEEPREEEDYETPPAPQVGTIPGIKQEVGSEDDQEIPSPPQVGPLPGFKEEDGSEDDQEMSPAPQVGHLLLSDIKELREDGVDENRDNENFSFSEMALITPIKMTEYDELSSRMTVNLKSVKRTLTSSNNSPYSKEEALMDDSATSSKQARYATQGKEMTKKRDCFFETDSEVLRRRQKQIDFGKNTVGYDNYIKLVPRDERKAGDPQTPNIKRKYSRRGFDGLVKQWRLKLHKYDP